MGMEKGWDTSPVHAVYVDNFYLDKHEVTNAQYYAFCEETGKSLPEFWGMEGNLQPQPSVVAEPPHSSEAIVKAHLLHDALTHDLQVV